MLQQKTHGIRLRRPLAMLRRGVKTALQTGLLASLAVLLLSGCQSERRKLAEEAPLVSIPIEDISGHTHRFNRPPQRIVTLGPNQTVLLFQLNAQGRLIARSDRSTDPPAAAPLAAVRTRPSLDLDTLLRMQPDCILATPDVFGATPLDTVRQVFARYNLPLVIQSYATLPEWASSTKAVGRLTNSLPAARELTASFLGFVDSTRQATQSRLQGKQRKRVAILTQWSPRTFAGDHHILSKLATAAGGSNVFAHHDAEKLFFPLDSLARYQPQLILVPPGTKAHFRAAAASIPGLQQSPALQEGGVEVIHARRGAHGGPQSALALVELASILQPKLDIGGIYGQYFQPLEAEVQQ